jgi:hypothetical protein
MTDEQAPNNSKTREIINILVLLCFTSVRVAGFEGGNYKPIDERMLYRSTKSRSFAGKNGFLKPRFHY